MVIPKQCKKYYTDIKIKYPSPGTERTISYIPRFSHVSILASEHSDPNKLIVYAIGSKKDITDHVASNYYGVSTEYTYGLVCGALISTVALCWSIVQKY